MKKRKILVVLLIGVLLTAGLVFASCEEEGCPNGGYCSTGGVNGTFGKSSCGESSCATTGKDQYTMSACNCN